jgi:peptide/nickel transport system permease protein
LEDVNKNIFKVLSWVFIAVFLLLCFGMWENIYSVKVSLSSANAGMSSVHPLGADQLGRDLLARFSVAVRNTVLPLWGVGAAAFFIGILISSVQYILDEQLVFRAISSALRSFSVAVLALPFGVIVFSVSVYFEGVSLKGILISGFFYIAIKTFLKLTRLLSESRNLGYWSAHESLGGSKWSRFYKYGVFRDFRAALTSEFVFNMKLLVAAEVTLSYLGFGVSEPNPSIGNILSSNIENALRGDPKILLTSIAVLFLVMFVPSFIQYLIELKSRDSVS